MTTCNPYLSFNGNCREAFEFYARVLDGKILMMQSNGDSPVAEHVPPAAHHLIMHARLEFDGQILMGGDAPPDRTTKPSGFMVAVGIDAVDRAERIFSALAEGGTVQMPFQPTFWAAKFGMCTDLYGTPWVINGGPTM